MRVEGEMQLSKSRPLAVETILELSLSLVRRAHTYSSAQMHSPICSRSLLLARSRRRRGFALLGPSGAVSLPPTRWPPRCRACAALRTPLRDARRWRLRRWAPRGPHKRGAVCADVITSCPQACWASAWPTADPSPWSGAVRRAGCACGTAATKRGRPAQSLAPLRASLPPTHRLLRNARSFCSQSLAAS